jgi:hypothetical protein
VLSCGIVRFGEVVGEVDRRRSDWRSSSAQVVGRAAGWPPRPPDERRRLRQPSALMVLNSRRRAWHVNRSLAASAKPQCGPPVDREDEAASTPPANGTVSRGTGANPNVAEIRSSPLLDVWNLVSSPWAFDDWMRRYVADQLAATDAESYYWR